MDLSIDGDFSWLDDDPEGVPVAVLEHGEARAEHVAISCEVVSGTPSTELIPEFLEKTSTLAVHLFKSGIRSLPQGCIVSLLFDFLPEVSDVDEAAEMIDGGEVSPEQLAEEGSLVMTQAILERAGAKEVFSDSEAGGAALCMGADATTYVYFADDADAFDLRLAAAIREVSDECQLIMAAHS